jgi:hypothetical protein
MSTRYIPEPSQIDAHHEIQVQRVERAFKTIDPGDVLSIIDGRIAAEADPTKHPLFKMVAWHLEKCLTPLDGAEFFDRFRQLVLAAIDTALDDALECLGED